MEIGLDKNAIAVAKGAATEESRPVLTCVRLGKGEIVSADGFILVRHPVEGQGDDYFKLLNAKTLLKAKPIKQFGTVLVHDNTEGILTLQTEVGKLQSPPEQGNYPNIEFLEDAARDKTPQYKAALTVSVLKKLLSTLGDADIIKFKFHEHGSTIQFKAGETHGLVMPAFVTDPAAWEW